MSLRIQWREWRGHLKTPVAGEVRWEDGHDAITAAGKVRELLQSDALPCWIYVERQDIDFAGKSTSKPEAREKKAKR